MEVVNADGETYIEIERYAKQISANKRGHSHDYFASLARFFLFQPVGLKSAKHPVNMGGLLDQSASCFHNGESEEMLYRLLLDIF